MRTVCIYCTAVTSGDATRAHVFPEAFGNKNLFLPPGTVCRKCNQYAGHELESALVAHPSIAMALHFLGVHGKEGRTRKQLGTLVNEPSEAGTVTIKFSIAAPKLTFHTDGTVETKANATVPAGFRHERFRRGLHYVAMNVLAATEAPSVVLESKYDAVRNYIRRPKTRHEAWPYAEESPPINDIPRILNGAVVADAPRGKIVALQIFQTTYWVDLLNSGDLVAGENQPGVKIVDQSVRTLPPVVIHLKAKPQSPPAA